MRSSYLSVDALEELELLPQEPHANLQLLLGQVQTVHVLRTQRGPVRRGREQGLRYSPCSLLVWERPLRGCCYVLPIPWVAPVVGSPPSTRAG